MTNKEAIETIKSNYPPSHYSMLREALNMAMDALQEPEIIMCKDCKYHCANYCTRDIKGRTNMFYMEDDSFCSEAIKAGEQE